MYFVKHSPDLKMCNIWWHPSFNRSLGIQSVSLLSA